MQRKYVLAYLLFSLFLVFLLCSCFLPTSKDLSRLASEAKYVELEKRTASMLSKRIDAETLYYRSLALDRLHEGEHAYHVLNLYFGMSKEDDRYMVEAHRLMCSLALEVSNPAQVIANAQWLENRSLLQEDEAESYYQALLLVGQNAEASKVFELYLQGTIAPYAYAQMVLGTHSDKEKLEEAFAPLTHQEQLTLLQSITSDIVLPERATILLFLATPLEQAFEGSADLVQVYSLLATLYGYADVRVLQRKYSTLAQNLR